MTDAMGGEMERIYARLKHHFGSAVRTLESALQRYRDAEQRLYRPDERKLYSDNEHNKRIRVLLEQLDAILQTVDQAATTAIEQAQTELAKLAGRTALSRDHCIGLSRYIVRR